MSTRPSLSRPTSSPSVSDRVRESAVRICESGPAALAGLYDLTSQRLVRYSLSLTRHQHDAEDAVQAALVRVADRPRLLARSEHPWPYLVRMVRNESLLILRRRGRTSSADLSDLVTRVSVDEAEWAETYRAVWRGIRSLPVEQGEVVVLKIWESMTFAEIGDVLGVPSSTAASRYRYAMEKLSHALEGFAGPTDASEPSGRGTEGRSGVGRGAR